MIPNTGSYTYNYTFPNFAFVNAQVASQLCNVVSPKFYEVPRNAFVSVTRVEWMNSEQTGNWVRTLAYHSGWKNGDDYARSFKENNINGLGLQHLTHDMLVESYGIENFIHRREILSAIRYLYWGFPMACDYLSSGARSSASEPESKVSASESDGSDNDRSFNSSVCNDGDQCVESETDSCANSSSPAYSSNTFSSPVCNIKSPSLNSGREHEMNGLSKSAMIGTRKSYLAVENSKSRMYQMHNQRTSQESYKTPVKSRKLRVTLNPEQDNGPETSKMLIRNRFQDLNIQVEDVKDLKNKPNVYVVVFSDCKRALDALSRSGEIGLPLKWQLSKRPGPNRIRKFKALTQLAILSGKSLTKSKFRGWLKEGTVVIVNQLKFRRARLVKEDANGKIVIIGWVNMNMQNGVQCLEQVFYM